MKKEKKEKPIEKSKVKVKTKKGSNWKSLKCQILKNPVESRKIGVHESNQAKSVTTKTKHKLEDLLNPDGRGTNLNTPVIGMDCEMVGVGIDNASALARVSIVNFYGAVLYDVFVKPPSKVTDYRTEFSGIHAEDLASDKAVCLREAQNRVFELMKDRIVVGHGISNDFEALLLSHSRKLIRDTATYAPLMFKKGGDKLKPHKLRFLLKNEYGERIQDDEHDSVDDARAALLVYRKHRVVWEKFILDNKRGKKTDKKEGEA